MVKEEGQKEGPRRPLQAADTDPVLPAGNPLQQLPNGGIARFLRYLDNLPQ